MTAPSEDRWLVRSIVLAQFGPAFMFSGVAVALPHMGGDLVMSATELGLVETTFLASSAAFLLPGGRFSDVASRGAVFRWMLLLFGVLSFAIGCASHGWMVLVLRFLQGIAAAFAMTAGPAYLVELVPAERRGRIFGAMMGTAYAGLALGPLVAGVLIETVGWRSVFFVGAAQILIGGVPAFRRISERWRWPRRGVHLPSAVLLVAAAAAVVVALSAAERAQPVWPWASAAVVLATVFLAWQLRIPDPLLDLRELRRNGTLLAALSVQLLLYLNAYCSIFLLSLFLQVGRGLDARSAGLWLALGSLMMACIAPFAGRIADRTQPHGVAALGVAAVLVSSWLGYRLDEESAVYEVGVVLAAQGIGFGLFSSPNLTVILASLPPERSGIASAVAAQSRSVGMFAGMAVTSALIALHFEANTAAENPSAVFDTLRSAYSVLLATSSLAFVGALVRRRAAHRASY